ncbi:MAG: MarR family transcriptional regulator [Rickettsiales bacterium]|nr:MarR family transcriptional regulator [Rickettsiales bacterium]|tara:strand:+ start:2545 stop:2922 length:378 start_codon:yes stop_codon:yes gene_type:complete
MNQPLHTLDALQFMRRITVAGLKELPEDLSSRQTAVLTTVYLTEPPHTIRNLSERLNISKPAVCRAVDGLSMMGLIKRKKDENDGRNVFIQRTVQGSVYLSDMADIVMRELQPEAIQDQREEVAA